MRLGGGVRAVRAAAAKLAAWAARIEAGAADAERERQARFIEARSERLKTIAQRGGNQHFGEAEARTLARHLAVIAQDVRIGLHDDRETAA